MKSAHAMYLGAVDYSKMRMHNDVKGDTVLMEDR